MLCVYESVSTRINESMWKKLIKFQINISYQTLNNNEIMCKSLLPLFVHLRLNSFDFYVIKSELNFATLLNFKKQGKLSSKNSTNNNKLYCSTT